MVSKKLPASLFVGAAATGKRTLVSKLIGTRLTTVHIHQLYPGKPLTGADSCGQWCINNPYYTADTKVVIRRPDGTKFGSLTGYEAIILVFDAADKSTWDAVQTWAHANADAADATEITLVRAPMHTVAMHHPCRLSQPSTTRPPPTAHGTTMCRTGASTTALSSSARLPVTSPPTPPSPGTVTQLQSMPTVCHSGADDPEGVARVRAALEAHMWPGLQRKDPAAAQGAPAQAPAGPAQAPPPLEELLREPQGHEGEDEGDVAKQAAEMDALFAEVAAAREAMHGMGDAARREAAARLALRLADAFGLEDEGSDEE